MEKIKFLVLTVLVLSYIFPFYSVFAQEVQIPEEPNITTNFFGCREDMTLRACIASAGITILRVLLVFAIVAAVIAFAWGGITFIVMSGKDDARTKAKNILIWSAVGLVVALLSFAAINILQRIISGRGI